MDDPFEHGTKFIAAMEGGPDDGMRRELEAIGSEDFLPVTTPETQVLLTGWYVPTRQRNQRGDVIYRWQPNSPVPPDTNESAPRLGTLTDRIE